jgi:hypothetical protein
MRAVRSVFRSTSTPSEAAREGPPAVCGGQPNCPSGSKLALRRLRPLRADEETTRLGNRVRGGSVNRWAASRPDGGSSGIASAGHARLERCCSLNVGNRRAGFLSADLSLAIYASQMGFDDRRPVLTILRTRTEIEPNLHRSPGTTAGIKRICALLRVAKGWLARRSACASLHGATD